MNTSGDYVGVSLRIWSHAHSPAEITTALGRTPEHSAVMGSPRGRSHGAELRTWKTHYWCSEFTDGTTAEERLEAVGRFLQAHGSEVESVLGPRGTAEVYVFLAPASTLGLILTSSMLKPFVDHGVQLDFEFLIVKSPKEAVDPSRDPADPRRLGRPDGEAT